MGEQTIKYIKHAVLCSMVDVKKGNNNMSPDKLFIDLTKQDG